ncbi:SMP-30/gluconolactonase/LRE family protein [Sphingomonas sp. BN140010]|uniref:SMP-30/gluconolactonase/LRE family protein n=1 Tax=Sphingomonas arvum TaxID=2992113 RepID=A0ABT3JFQ5_9SPHN|nr:SMP-30/gluconolactonase/LRE family protein [Sphingomonas sp. BN140010]MCW3797912.1 SMP-30/gluconolactonase/LRE family protein [Sphingomonas sp. BN140010]
MTKTTLTLLDGLYFGEGPRWHEGRLWFSDFHAHRVCSVSLTGDLRVELELDDQPSGLGWMPDGSLLVVSMRKRQLLRRGADGQVRLHADLSGVHAMLSNDMVVDGHGRAYVGNFGFDLHGEIRRRGDMAVFADHPTAAIALVQPNGTVEVAADGLHFPNGSVITPDGRTLIVGETMAGLLTAFDIGADGRLSNRRVWAQTVTDLERPRIPDGICLDAAGAVWIANPTAPECVRVGDGGAVLDVVEFSQNCFACMLGGEDGRTLFAMTAPTSDFERAGAAPNGRIELAEVSNPHAGRP